ncbi:hypothetical protein, partial [Escherichia coli]|uniref:hypothetical protein n=1 Tax=Escherichia coli TaxID=562 RepID=UPI003F290F55
VVVAAWQPWVGPAPAQEAQEWEPLGDFLGSGVPLPPEAADLQVSVSGVTSVGTRRLVRSAVDTYDRSRAFYADAVEAA